MGGGFFFFFFFQGNAIDSIVIYPVLAIVHRSQNYLLHQ